MSTEKQETAKYLITRKIAELLKLGNNGKLDSFFTKVVKKLKRDVQALEKNKETLKFNYEQAIESFNERIEDFEESLKEAYMNVNPDDILTNEAQNNIISVYLKGISNARAALKNELALKTECKKVFEEETEKLSKRIDTRILDIVHIK
jgi:translation initiation factor 2 alpha subunit (eIF-2alpha)